MMFGPHAAGHLVILTFPVDQSISGLCSTSHMCPMMMVFLPISANTCDVEGGPLQMIPILDHEVKDFSDVASIIEGPVHIVDRDGSRETLGVKVLGSDIVNINKLAGGP